MIDAIPEFDADSAPLCGESRRGCVPNTQLPNGWTAKLDARLNKRYFEDHASKTTTWDDPRPLPNDWQRRKDPHKGRTYFLNHVTKVTQWEDPRPWPPASNGNTNVPKPKQKLPRGWESKKDSRTNNTYYVNRKKSIKRWDMPKNHEANSSSDNSDDELPSYGDDELPPYVQASSPRDEQKKRYHEEVPPSKSQMDESELEPCPYLEYNNECNDKDPVHIKSYSHKQVEGKRGENRDAEEIDDFPPIKHEDEDAERIIQDLLPMGFTREQISGILEIHSNKEEWRSDMVAEWILSGDTMEVPRLKRNHTEEDNKFMRQLLEEDRAAGVPLTTGQMNLLLMPEHRTGQEYECCICYDDVELEKTFVLEGCKHYTCGSCMSRHIETLVTSMKVDAIICPTCDCFSPINHNEIRRCLGTKQIAQYEQLLLESSLKKDPDVRWCPKPGCGTAVIGNSANPMIRCQNAKCDFCFCFNCKESWHTDFTCEQYQLWKEENAQADDKFTAWAKRNTKPCPKCKCPIEKNGGCNHMKCLSCKFEFCWLCMQSVLGPDGKYKAGHWALDEKSPCYEKMHT